MDDYGEGEYYANALYEERMCEQYDGNCKECPLKNECDGAKQGF